MVATKLGGLVCLALSAFSMVGCGTDLKFADDGAGAASDGGGAADGGTSSAGGVGQGGGNAVYDLESECAALCNQPCVGSPTNCTENCVEAGMRALGCERESVDWYACSMDYCVGEQDCWEFESDVYGCLNRGGCEDPENGNFQLLCESPSPSVCNGIGCEEVDACGCSAPCYDGHSASVSCDVDWEDYDDVSNSPRFDCRCFFDDELVGECTTYDVNSCLVEYSCCRGWFAVD